MERSLCPPSLPSLPYYTLQPGLATPPLHAPTLQGEGLVNPPSSNHSTACRQPTSEGNERTTSHGAWSCASRCSLRRAHRRAHVRANTGENTRSRSANEGEAALGEIRGTQACGGDDDDEEKQRQSCESG